MKRYYLGIDTSCYTTSCAIIDSDFQIVGEARKILEVKQGERGLQQSNMVFQHTKALPKLISGFPAAPGDLPPRQNPLLRDVRSQPRLPGHCRRHRLCSRLGGGRQQKAGIAGGTALSAILPAGSAKDMAISNKVRSESLWAFHERCLISCQKIIPHPRPCARCRMAFSHLRLVMPPFSATQNAAGKFPAAFCCLLGKTTPLAPPAQL